MRIRRLRACLALFATLTLAPTAFGQSMSQTPLILQTSDPASLMLSLSIEYPTAGRAYNPSSTAAAATSRTYTPGTAYVGYFDYTRCYTYDTTLRAFVPSSAANSSYECPSVNAFAGNFMNWVSMSSIDILRLALTGGWRVRDDTSASGSTIVSRAYLPDNFYAASTNFARSSVTAAVAANVTPFKSLTNKQTLYIASCRDRIFFGTTKTGSCTAPDATVGSTTPVTHVDASPTDGYFARIKVCADSTEVAQRSDLCVAYGTSSSQVYKPVGLFQKYADRIRFGIGAYIMDNVGTRYGGMIRVALKNVVNEWDATSGALIANPDSASEGNSGAINFLNKFGLADPSLTPTSFPGWNSQTASYKTYDTMSELYFEVMQYLRGKQPTALAYSGLTSTMKSGFPALTSWTDPFSSTSCPNPYIINVSDTNTWCDFYLPGNTHVNTSCGDTARSVGSDDVDAVSWTTQLGNSLNTLSNGLLSNRSTLATDTTGAGNTASYYAAGLAYWAKQNDIRPDIGGTQHVTTYSFDVNEPSGIAVHDRQLYLMGLAGGTGAFDSNGDPTSYILASNPGVLFTSLQTSFAAIASDAGTQSSIAMTSGRITVGSKIYTTSFKTKSWVGNLQAFNAYTDAQVWSAASLLTSDTGRQIITRVNGAGAAFQWSSLSTAQQTVLNTNEAGSTDGRGQERLAWLRGSAASEGTAGSALRKRYDSALGPTKLGDIINSTPWVAGPPTAGWSYSGYASYAASYRGRRPVVYVGANDGLLHGFDANTGVEVLAYLPATLFTVKDTGGTPTLSKLPALNYDKTAYVDGSPMVGDAYANNAWRSILVGTLGAGGRGIFALDVTNPGAAGAAAGTGAFTENNASSLSLWEYSSADDADLGYIPGAPVQKSSSRQPAQYVKLANGKWAVAVGNGYFSTNTRPVLFLFYLDGSGYIKLVAASSGSETSDNGLGTPTPVDINNDGVVDVIYAGDRRGNLWRFALSAKAGITGVTDDPSTWSGATSGNPPLLLFTATDGSGNRQPISGAPLAAYNSAAKQGWLIAFGTGKLYEDSDRSSTSVQSIYGIWDKDGKTSVSGRSSLSATAFKTATFTSSTTSYTYRTISSNCVRYASTQTSCGTINLKSGWYVDLPASGERAVGNAETIVNNDKTTLVVTSLVPPASSGCGQTYSSWLNLFDFLSGGASQNLYFDTDGSGNGNPLANSVNTGSPILGVGIAMEQHSSNTSCDPTTDARCLTCPATNPDCKRSSNSCGQYTVVKARINNAISTLLAASACNNGRFSWREFLNP